MHRGARTRKEVERSALSTRSGASLAAVSCAILLVMAAAILARVREGPLKGAPGSVVSVLAWFTTIYAAVAVVVNLATQSFVGAGGLCADVDPPFRARRDRDGRLSTDPLAHPPATRPQHPSTSRGGAGSDGEQPASRATRTQEERQR